MARIAGIDLPKEKRIEIGLTYIYGIGRTSANKILAQAGISPDVRVKDLSEEDEAKLREIIGHDYTVEGDLRRNVERAGADIDIIGGDAARELPELGELDALVVDPPRAGLADGVVASIAAASPRRVAYVSCDASTWARDVARFEQEGYRLIRVTPVDLFPQTYHVEVVSIFERSGS